MNSAVRTVRAALWMEAERLGAVGIEDARTSDHQAVQFRIGGTPVRFTYSSTLRAVNREYVLNCKCSLRHAVNRALKRAA